MSVPELGSGCRIRNLNQKSGIRIRKRIRIRHRTSAPDAGTRARLRMPDPESESEIRNPDPDPVPQSEIRHRHPVPNQNPNPNATRAISVTPAQCSLEPVRPVLTQISSNRGAIRIVPARRRSFPANALRFQPIHDSALS
jgi:hypothetical protein